MPISVKASFAQEGVFFAGERLQCTITFTNTSPATWVTVNGQSQDHDQRQGQTRSSGSTQLPPRPPSLQQPHPQRLQQQQHQQQQSRQPLDTIDGQRIQPTTLQSGAQAATMLHHDNVRSMTISPTSPSSTPTSAPSPSVSPINVESRAQSRANVPHVQSAGSSASLNAVESSDRPSRQLQQQQQRPGLGPGRSASQGRMSSEISHIEVISATGMSDQKTRQGTVMNQEQGEDEEQEEQETSVVVAPPPAAESDLEARSKTLPSDPLAASSPGILGLASYMYRSASFSSLASAFGLAGGEGSPVLNYDDKKLPPLPPSGYTDMDIHSPRTVLPPVQILSPENEVEQTTRESFQGLRGVKNSVSLMAADGGEDPEKLARMGTPIGLGLEMNGQRSNTGDSNPGHSRTATNGSISGLRERMIELQVSDSTADTQSVVDESDMFQTPRPSMDYSTRSSMQSVRGPFPHQFERSTRRSSLMSSYSTASRTVPSTGSKKESVLWSSVQIVGQFMVDGSFIRQQGFEPLRSKTMYRTTGTAGGGAIGGGTLGTVGPVDWREKANANRLLPVFSTPPSILFIDLSLLPGESTSYTYQLDLPSELPPTYRGKTIRFSYHLVLGVQRGSVHNPAKNVHIPFRLYNNISEMGTRSVYDLMSPVILHKDTAVSNLVGGTRPAEKTDDNSKLARKQFEDYVDGLIGSIKHNGESISPSQTREMTRRESDAYKDEEVVLNQSCLEKVALLSRSASSASYDICKNNVPVAKLSLIKTRFKLGETVHGVISFATREIPTYQISVTLETVEAIEPDYACRSAAQTSKLTKRVHAEHHESCIDTMRTSFALCIPPTATPEFKTTTLTLKWYLRVEFITGPANQPRFKMTSVDERRSQYQAVESLSTENFDCSVPIQVYPTSFETGALYSPSVVFNLA